MSEEIPPQAEKVLEVDHVPTAEAGNVDITFIGHGSLMLTYKNKIIHVDPCTMFGDYSKLPPADMILITHDHFDHLDAKALKAVRTPSTVVVLAACCASGCEGGVIIKNGETFDFTIIFGSKFMIEAVPAYNLVNMRPDNGEPFHPPGVGNGYVLTFDDKKIYIAGDTENVPEMKKLKDIDVAFLPMNLPYTMTPEMCANAALMFNPKVLYPYHFGSTDTKLLADLLKDSKTEVRVRNMGFTKPPWEN